MSTPPSGSIDPAQSVGGQAVLEGVMMRAPTAWAVAVRRPDGVIEAQRHELPKLSSRSKWARVPLVRGMLVLGESLSLGFRALSWSAQKSVGEDEEELSRTELIGSLTLAMVLFVGLFIVLPAAAANLMVGESDAAFVVLEAVIRLVLFVAYIWALGRSREIRRVFQYHGAEHMSIHAYENGQPLSVHSVKRYRPEHPRCGTSFLLIVILLAIVVFTLVGRPSWPWLVGSRILGIPLIAGMSYELLRWSGTHSSERVAAILAAPGLWLQKLTTGVPEEPMIEVAVASLLSALDDAQVDEILARGDVPEISVQARAR
ncbi:MAG TPA: DUF1385 domain-containing protein [Acidimicrobiia bacterium]|nr:DUF1385 domain-containing protein [Acidimicrobiia bacterium]